MMCLSCSRSGSCSVKHNSPGAGSTGKEQLKEQWARSWAVHKWEKEAICHLQTLMESHFLLIRETQKLEKKKKKENKKLT